jgi:hypothetical protein
MNIPIRFDDYYHVTLRRNDRRLVGRAKLVGGGVAGGVITWHLEFDADGVLMETGDYLDE